MENEANFLISSEFDIVVVLVGNTKKLDSSSPAMTLVPQRTQFYGNCWMLQIKCLFEDIQDILLLSELSLDYY